MVGSDSTDDGEGPKGKSPDAENAGEAPSGGDGVTSALPVSGRALLLTAAKASVPGERLPALVESAQSRLAGERERYEQTFECLLREDDATVYLVPSGHWEDLGTTLGLAERECDALRRAHAEHVRLCGSERGRREEFETALEIREAVVIGDQSG